MAQAACVALLSVGILGIIAGNDAVIGIGFGLGFVTLLLGALLPVATRGYRRMLDEMVAGQRFAHWTCGDEDWRRHLASERQPRMTPIFYGLLYGSVIGLALASLIAGVDHFGNRRLTAGQLTVVAVAALGVSLVICGAIGSVFAAVRIGRDHLLRRGGGNIYIGRQGLYYSGEFWPSHSASVRFLEIHRDTGPSPALVFDFHIQSRHSYNQRVRVPIPPGREREAQHALEQVRSAWAAWAGIGG